MESQALTDSASKVASTSGFKVNRFMRFLVNFRVSEFR